MNWRVSLFSALTCVCVGAATLHAQQSAAYLTTGESTSAVDAKGRRHTAAGEVSAPWLNDRVKAVAPDYPYAERARHHTGEGRFHLYLDLATGMVTNVIVTKSTGFSGLDRCAMDALRKWRWKPGRWKEIELPVGFIIRLDIRGRPGDIRLPAQ